MGYNKYTEEDKKDIYQRLSRGELKGSVAKHYNTSYSTITKIYREFYDKNTCNFIENKYFVKEYKNLLKLVYSLNQMSSKLADKSVIEKETENVTKIFEIVKN